MISDKLIGLDFNGGIYQIDTRSFRIDKCEVLPERLYILDSDPISRNELLEFLSIVLEKRENFSTDWTNEISEGFWPLKYIYVIPKGDGQYYILNRYQKKINWKKILTV
jgi:hypothetical protein